MGARVVVKNPAVVGVIASQGELRAAARIRRPPDLFELRLDCLPDIDPTNVLRLRRPLIITARNPAEGGCNKLAFRRDDRLREFLPCAAFIDVELRSLRELRAVWKEAGRRKIQRICSVHNFARTPSHAVLLKQFQRARSAGANIFKLVTRADTPDDFLTLLQFLRRARGRCCVMAIGRFGPISRLLLAECGSVLVYAALQQPLYPGQLTLRELRQASRPWERSLRERAEPRPPARLR
ncbi:MAG: hypothetical protein DLM52_08030 [Chthoniobacterales bacterium]|nr:MAG: hypothetical protein DLM52_08030 [Chthoniobacterales bacterium]